MVRLSSVVEESTSERVSRGSEGLRGRRRRLVNIPSVFYKIFTSSKGDSNILVLDLKSRTEIFEAVLNHG